jgi:hypothetical protein
MEDHKGSTTEHFEPPRRGSTGSGTLREKTIHAHSATLAAALSEDKPNPWSKGYLRLYAICFLVYLSSTMTGKTFRPV